MRVFLLALLVTAACPATPPPVSPTDRPSYAPSPFVSFTDAQTARDLAITGENLFLATDGGLLIMERETGKASLWDEKAGLFGRDLRAISWEGGDLWVAGPGKMARLREGKWEIFPGVEAPLALVPDPAGGLLLGAEGGLYRVLADGLLEEVWSGAVSSLTPHGEGILIAGAEGLFLYRRGEVRPVEGWEGVALFSVARRGALTLGITGDAEGRPRVLLAREGTLPPWRLILDEDARLAGGGPCALAVGRRVYQLAGASGEEEFLALGRSGRGFALLEVLARPPSMLRVLQGEIFAGVPSGGVFSLGEETRVFATRDLLVTGERVFLGSGGEGDVFLPTTGRYVARLMGDRFVRVAVDEGEDVRVLALASEARHGIYALLRREGRRGLYLKRWDGEGFVSLGRIRLSSIPPRVGVRFFEISPEGDFWIGLLGEEGFSLGLLVVASDLSVAEHLRFGKEPKWEALWGLKLPSDAVAQVRFVRGATWIATNGGVIWRRNGKTRMFGENEGLDSEIVHDIAIDRLDFIWIATSDGVGVLQRGGRWNFDRYRAILGDARVRALLNTEEGTMWLGTRGGAYYWRASSQSAQGKWGRLTVEDGFCGNDVVDIVQDQRGRLWYLTEAGLCAAL